MEILVGLAIDQLNLVNMTEMVNVHDAKTRLSELLARVERGDDFVIARGGKPVATLKAIDPAPRRELGFAPGPDLPDSFWEPLGDDDLAVWGL